jgi:hypothetical protein
MGGGGEGMALPESTRMGGEEGGDDGYRLV